MSNDRRWPDMPVDPDEFQERPKSALRQMIEQALKVRALITELRAVGIFLHIAEGEKVRWHTTTETAMSVAQDRAVKRLELGIKGFLRAESYEVRA